MGQAFFIDILDIVYNVLEERYMRRAVFSILVDNSSGVLSRVAGLFSRRG